METDKIKILEDTLHIFNWGRYMLDDRWIETKLSKAECRGVVVFLPEDIERIINAKDMPRSFFMGKCWYSCENMDAFALARKRYAGGSDARIHKDTREILVLNMANPVNPGGGVRRGARAQEEDLCRSSSLLLSLESRAASVYYDYNRSLHTHMGSDAIIISPKVEIIRDENGNLLPDSAIVAVMTCAAPMLIYGKEGMTESQYRGLLYRRIEGMLKCAAYLGYENLVLGAFGCGAFKNDANVVADAFFKVLSEFDYGGMKAKDVFQQVDFAVLDRSKEQYNYKAFCRSLDCFWRNEAAAEVARAIEAIKEPEVDLDKIRGCLFGGAAGDALGYPVEFMSADAIFAAYGSRGIASYKLDAASGKALISDDTQMTLFTANGLLYGETMRAVQGIQTSLRDCVAMAYMDWLYTQQHTYAEAGSLERGCMNDAVSWLLDVPQLYDRRAPGNTCLSALNDLKSQASYPHDYIATPQNDSKGCGGIMRVAPIALAYRNHEGMETISIAAAQLAAITHGHSLGYMPAAVLAHIISGILSAERKRMTLKEIVIEARDAVAGLFKNDAHIAELIAIIDKAVTLSDNDADDLTNISAIGEGWVAEETLGIAIYCALRHSDDFSAGIIAAVNHGGDSDSTGAVTGNILGALLGFEGIESKWKQNMELADVILEMADDLCRGCHMLEISEALRYHGFVSEYPTFYEADWARKYRYAYWKEISESAPKAGNEEKAKEKEISESTPKADHEEKAKEKVVICARCGLANPDGTAYCPACGYRILSVKGLHPYEIANVVARRNAPACDSERERLRKDTQKAMEVATAAHAGQLDKGGKPYIQHPMAVYRMIAEGTEQEPLKTVLANSSEQFRLQAGIVALLHDVLEDTKVPLAYLEKECRFPYECMRALEVITKDKNEAYEEYLGRVRRNKLATVVKIADLLHNSDVSRIPAPGPADRARVAKYQAAIKTLSQFRCECCGETLPLYFMSDINTRIGQVFCDVCYAEYDILYDMAQDAFWGGETFDGE